MKTIKGYLLVLEEWFYDRIQRDPIAIAASLHSHLIREYMNMIRYQYQNRGWDVVDGDDTWIKIQQPEYGFNGGENIILRLEQIDILTM